MTLEFKTNSVEQTQEIAFSIGKSLRGGEFIELISDVGGGKTTFVSGLVKGAGSDDHVSSPTFTISKVYDTEKFQIIHFDFYRLQEAGMIEHEICEAMNETNAVIIVEWSSVIQHILPENRVSINIKSEDEESRTFNIKYPPELEYLIKDVQ